ncbi:hypothetical protein [Azospirillum doebereinerae]|nr:hypothetical protein [Azospirillum doebereinerae]MCG5242022.1 hypothetical protein [Azospirillum doebereinerae]
MTNQAAGVWAGAFANAAKRNQSAFLKALTTPPKPPSKPRKPAKRKPR